ncbi:hypothetical protein CQA49_06450 [Helicobacter sp. MIT 00-7814]|uniref:hypothetical protein n=1 Tax=unclassified Helicobacter TaxID=2593540 RepID=UPI000E1EF6BE|nr:MULTISPECIES: hypothetical protein [unclassified Helicobacter]RDU53556.1 hypothetical protein CQA49_06450 [Helicobacter sp. MIT 00-7814]RDU57018.1 hypothetical protein CQA37_01015 [Helicobacter sp. MIT 99-10781]
MEISKVTLQDGSDALKVVGKIKTYKVFLEFKQEIEFYLEAYQNKEKEGKYSFNGETFRIYFVRAYPLNSYTLGFLCKLLIEDKIRVEVIVDTLRMFAFFEEVDLVNLFEVKIREED